MPNQRTASASALPGDRGARRRRETRARLVHAAREVMARKGIGATSIQEITETADVGFGSFYNHFESKDAIVDAVMEDAIEAFGDAADRIGETVKDPAEVIAASIRHAVLKTGRDPAWGWFLVRTGLTRTDGFTHGLGRRLARDIQIGIAARRFKVADPVAVTTAVAGAILSLIAGRLHGVLGKDAPERAAQVVLQLLGVSAKEAKHLVGRALPQIELSEE